MRKIVAIIAALSLVPIDALAAFPDDWGRRVQITVSSTYVDSDLSGWTMILTEDVLPSEMFDADGSYPALNGGGDIRISTGTDAGSQQAIDIRTFTTDNDPANGVADIAVYLPDVTSASDTTFYIWWSSAGATQPSASDTYGQYNAYDTYYELVWPLNGDADDRTDNGRNGTWTDASATYTTGAFGHSNGAADFDGTGSLASAAHIKTSWADPTVPNTIVALAKKDGDNSQSNAKTVACWGSSTDKETLGRGIYTGSSPSAAYHLNQDTAGQGSQGLTSTNTVADGEWRYIAQRTPNWSNLAVFLNTGSNNTSITANQLDELTDFMVGAVEYDGDMYGFMNGQVDEVRVSYAARSNTWLKAEYYNLLDPTSFASAGTPETPGATPSGGGTTRRRVIITE